MAELLEQMKEAIIDGDTEKAAVLAQTALDQGMSPLEALEKGFSQGMAVLGEQFEKEEIFLPELLSHERCGRGVQTQNSGTKGRDANQG